MRFEEIKRLTIAVDRESQESESPASPSGPSPARSASLSLSPRVDDEGLFLLLFGSPFLDDLERFFPFVTVSVPFASATESSFFEVSAGFTV
jgi:hypothetical protein